MKNNLLITNPKKLEEIKQAISKEGAKKLHVIADFDKTLTYAFVKGEKIPSLISILRNGEYLTKDYVSKAHALFNKYHPMETDPNIPLEGRKKAMQKWWRKHFDLLIKSGLNRKDLESVIQSEKIKLRAGVLKFIEFLYKKGIPLVILSSTGLGGDAISLYLQKYKRLYPNVYVVSNAFVWDKNGKAIGVKEPIIHCLNKDETAIKNFPLYGVIKNRRNVILLGDSVGDVDMVKGFDYTHLIKIGFLNEEVKENLELYKDNYDLIILNDSDLNYVNNLIREIAK